VKFEPNREPRRSRHPGAPRCHAVATYDSYKGRNSSEDARVLDDFSGSTATDARRFGASLAASVALYGAIATGVVLATAVVREAVVEDELLTVRSRSGAAPASTSASAPAGDAPAG
jgi:hypothetical protein